MKAVTRREFTREKLEMMKKLNAKIATNVDGEKFHIEINLVNAEKGSKYFKMK